jgi:hypothetical protein
VNAEDHCRGPHPVCKGSEGDSAYSDDDVSVQSDPFLTRSAGLSTFDLRWAKERPKEDVWQPASAELRSRGYPLQYAGASSSGRCRGQLG